MISNTASDLLASSIDFLLGLGKLLLTAAVYFLLARLGSKLIISRVRNNPFLKKYGKNGELIIFRMVSILAYGIASIALLSQLGFHANGILTLLSALTVAIGLSLQDVLRNLIAGLFMVAERPFKVGDRVAVRDSVGTVQGIDIRTTMLRTDDGSLLMVPNNVMFTEIVRNDSRYNMQTITFNITTTVTVQELTEKMNRIANEIEGVRPSAESPVLIKHDDESTEWQVSFAMNTRQMTSDHDVFTGIVAALPDATIVQVMPS